MNELQPLLDLLPGKTKTIVLLSVPASLWFWGVCLKPFNLRLQQVLTERLANAIDDQSDAEWYHKLLDSGWYRLGSFLLDTILRIKLPTHADFHRLMNERCEAAAKKTTV